MKKLTTLVPAGGNIDLVLLLHARIACKSSSSSLQMPAFRNQITAADNIRAAFRDGKHYAMLVAKCMSGKTGTFQFLIKKMLRLGIIDRAYILCGSSETRLRDQAIKDTRRANPDAYDAGRIKIIFHQHFKTERMNVERALIVVDETHLVQSLKQQLQR